RAFTDTLYAPGGGWQTDSDDYTAWFTWLVENQEKPNIIFNDQTWFLEQKFVDGDVAYFIGSTAGLVRLREQVGEDILGVAPIPRGPAGFAEPLGQPEVIVFNRYTTPRAISLGLRLARFLYNPSLQQQFVLQGVGRAPGYRPPEGRRSLVIRPNLSETGSALAQQGRRAIIVPVNDIASFRDLIVEANTIYLGMLNGGLEPDVASQRLSERINSLLPSPGDE
ncbi:MAG: hypothetical protein F6K39_46365, partial [Okeania sp. SIO3B3]|nr:hypothetical protein [Okeania sp. SIO3B3]